MLFDVIAHLPLTDLNPLLPSLVPRVVIKSFRASSDNVVE